LSEIEQDTEEDIEEGMALEDMALIFTSIVLRAYGALRGCFKGVTAFAASSIVIIGAITAPQAKADNGAIKVVALGDSLTHGYGLPYEHGFTQQLQAWLQVQGVDDVIVINAGVSGDTTSGGLSRLDWSVGPDAGAVILELGANDALRNIHPDIVRANLDNILRRLAQRNLPVLLAGMRSPRNWGADYVDAFESIYPDLVAKYRVIFYPFFLKDVAAMPALNQEDRIHPNKEGVAVIVENIGPKVIELIQQARERRVLQ
jgi:acyl-CoA thioesterase-1